MSGSQPFRLNSDLKYAEESLIRSLSSLFYGHISMQEEISRMIEQCKPQEQPNNPLHGMTLEKILVSLVDFFGWEGLFDRINLRCFFNEPGIKSSLKYLRRTGWAREEVEKLYLEMLNELNDGG